MHTIHSGSVYYSFWPRYHLEDTPLRNSPACVCVHVCWFTQWSKQGFHPLDWLHTYTYIPPWHQCNVPLCVHMHTLLESHSVAAHQVVWLEVEQNNNTESTVTVATVATVATSLYYTMLSKPNYTTKHVTVGIASLQMFPYMCRQDTHSSKEDCTANSVASIFR